MSVAISLPPDVEDVVRQQAERVGQDVTAFVLQVLQAVQEKVAKTQAAKEGAGEMVASDLEKRFLALAALWRYGVGPASSITQIVAHPAYLQIIGLGGAVLPFLFAELARQPDHWFYALAAITGEDPVPPDAQGSLAAMTDVWLAWGRAHGYL